MKIFLNLLAAGAGAGLLILSPPGVVSGTGAGYTHLFLFTFIAAFLLTQAAARAGEKLDIRDYPDKRKIHSRPVPLTGGAAVLLSFLLATIFYGEISSEIVGIAGGLLIIFLLGIIDDKYTVRASVKLIIQFAAVTVVIISGISVSVVPYSVPGKYFLDALITYIGILGITNAFNYMDGMDGEAPGLAVISALTLFFIAFDTGGGPVAFFSVTLAGSCAGFLIHNFPRAGIFLGDNGSTVIGFLLATLAIASSWDAASAPVAVVTPLLIFSLYIFDMIYTTVSRIRNNTVRNLKEWFEVTGKDHFHHRLTNIGFTRARAVIIIWLCAVIFGISAFVIRRATPLNAIAILAQSLLVYLLITVLMIAGKKNTGETE